MKKTILILFIILTNYCVCQNNTFFLSFGNITFEVEKVKVKKNKIRLHSIGTCNNNIIGEGRKFLDVKFIYDVYELKDLSLIDTSKAVNYSFNDMDIKLVAKYSDSKYGVLYLYDGSNILKIVLRKVIGINGNRRNLKTFAELIGFFDSLYFSNREPLIITPPWLK